MEKGKTPVNWIYSIFSMTYMLFTCMQIFNFSSETKIKSHKSKTSLLFCILMQLKTVKENLSELENNSKDAKQTANGYFYKRKKEKEENRLLYSASCKELR